MPLNYVLKIAQGWARKKGEAEVPNVGQRTSLTRVRFVYQYCLSLSVYLSPSFFLFFLLFVMNNGWQCLLLAGDIA